MAQNITQDANANTQIRNRARFKELEKLIGRQETRIQSLQTSAFQLANYYFVFQGVVLIAISNTTTLTCSDSWYIFTLSFLAATLNLIALFSIGTKYLRAIDLHDQTWSEFNYIFSTDHQSNLRADELSSLDFTGQFSPGNNSYYNRDRDRDRSNNGVDDVWRDRFSTGKRYVGLAACMVFFVAFTGVMLSGPWLVTCKHDEHRNHPYGDKNGLDCLKLCNGSRCIIFCQEGY